MSFSFSWPLKLVPFTTCFLQFCMKWLHTRLSGTNRWQRKRKQRFSVDQHLLEANDWKIHDWFNEKVCKTHVNIIFVKRIGIFSNSIRLLKIISTLNVFVFVYEIEFQNYVCTSLNCLCVCVCFCECNDNEIEMNTVQCENRWCLIVMVCY